MKDILQIMKLRPVSNVTLNALRALKINAKHALLIEFLLQFVHARQE
jgi:hypothetical protein